VFGKDFVQFQTFRAPTISLKEDDMEKPTALASPDVPQS